MAELTSYFVFFIFSIGVSFYLNKVVFKMFYQSKMLDPINKRSSHKAKATRSGGLALLLSVFLCYALAGSAGLVMAPYGPIAISVVFMALLGFVDDLISVQYRIKFFLQLFAGLVVVQSGWSIDSFFGVFGVFEIPSWAGSLISLFVFVVVVNSLNLIDGLDGLASLVSLKFFLIVGGIILVSNKDMFIFFPIIIGALIGFLTHNFSASKKVFLGDSGSLFLGSLVAIFIIFVLDSDNSIITDAYISRPLLMVLSVFYPLVDTLRAVVLRSYKGLSPFVADRIHLHHRLIDKGYEHWTASVLILCLSVLLIIINFFVFQIIGLLLCVIMTMILCLIFYRFLFK